MAAAQDAPADPNQAACQDDDVALYWDPRYHSYFYAGVMTPPTGKLYDFTGTPVAHTSDIHTWSIVELVQEEGTPALSPYRPILSERDALGRPKQARRKRRLSWSRLGREPRVAASQESAEKGNIPVCCRVQSLMCCALVLVIIFVVLFWMNAFNEEEQSNIGDGPTVEQESSAEDGPIASSFEEEREHPQSPRPNRQTTAMEGRFLREHRNESLYTDATPP